MIPFGTACHHLNPLLDSKDPSFASELEKVWIKLGRRFPAEYFLQKVIREDFASGLAVFLSAPPDRLFRKEIELTPYEILPCIHAAVLFDSLDCVRLLLRSDPSLINIKDAFGISVIRRAVALDRIRVLEVLFDSVLAPNTKNEVDFASLLSDALDGSQSGTFQFILEHAPLPVEYPHDVDDILRRAMWGALRWNELALADCILKHRPQLCSGLTTNCSQRRIRDELNSIATGVDPLAALTYYKKRLNGSFAYSTLKQSDNLLHDCCRRGETQIVSDILSLEPSMLNARDACGFTPLMVAVRSFDLDLVKWLIEHAKADEHAAPPEDSKAANLMELIPYGRDTKGGTGDIYEYLLVERKHRATHDCLRSLAVRLDYVGLEIALAERLCCPNEFEDPKYPSLILHVNKWAVGPKSEKARMIHWLCQKTNVDLVRLFYPLQEITGYVYGSDELLYIYLFLTALAQCPDWERPRFLLITRYMPGWEYFQDFTGFPPEYAYCEAPIELAIFLGQLDLAYFFGSSGFSAVPSPQRLAGMLQEREPEAAENPDAVRGLMALSTPLRPAAIPHLTSRALSAVLCVKHIEETQGSGRELLPFIPSEIWDHVLSYVRNSDYPEFPQEGEKRPLHAAYARHARAGRARVRGQPGVDKEALNRVLKR
jgi:hypothetical protein